MGSTTESCYGIIFRNYITGLYYGIISRDYVVGSYYGIILRNDVMESYYGISLMRRIPGIPGEPLEPPGTPQTSLGDARGTPGHALGRLGDAPKTPRGPPGTPMDHKNSNISPNIQRRKLSIAVFELACWDPLPQRLPWTVLSIEKPPKQKTVPGFPGGRYGYVPIYILYIYIYMAASWLKG